MLALDQRQFKDFVTGLQAPSDHTRNRAQRGVPGGMTNSVSCLRQHVRKEKQEEKKTRTEEEGVTQHAAGQKETRERESENRRMNTEKRRMM
ncbi:hypothetical protein NDU88_000724 [Pleurodeles waltl]|uniref:Uncharacterized protein n=1 Tax=Pleurodeles waltl TaxID=8319 RepID=A0AAV7UU73_PLEWA|nr:hypothetical protein NDU88_000724 [Pleurodeles waltl]